jgi:hypothetical protein
VCSSDLNYNQAVPVTQIGGIDTANYADATVLWRSCSIRTLKNTAGWYSDGAIARYWNGTVFTTTVQCDQ